MRIRIFAVFLILSLFTVQSTFADQSQTVRIGLNRYFSHSTTVFLSSEQSYTLYNGQNGKPIVNASPKSITQVSICSHGINITTDAQTGQAKAIGSYPSVNATPSATALLHIYAQQSSSQWHTYRGNLTIWPVSSMLGVINTVPLEAYLYGVIPAEIGTQAPAEAVKAQAVASRTYALKNLNRFAAEGYDLDDTTRCQGYLGADKETPAINAEIDATRGQVLCYQGQLIDAPYSTDSGGVTACDLTGKLPYLQAVHDAPADNQPDYAANSKYHHWVQLLKKSQLQELLAQDPRTQVGTFESLSIDGVDASGRITTATVAGVDGTMKTVTGTELREIIGNDTLRSTRVKLTITASGDYQFEGWGWGHGYGMSQTGAIAMASQPYNKSYTEILSHYYPGTKITQVNTLSAVKTAQRGF